MAQLILLPGIGANHLLFSKTLGAFPQGQVPPWQVPLPKESIPAYAKRWAPSFSEGPYVLVGMSFGGMVALELAKWVNTQSVVLLSSCWETKAIQARFRVLEQISRWVPDFIVRQGVRTLGAPVTAKRQGVSSAEKDLLVQMSRDLDLPFARWACFSASTWQFNLSQEENLPYPLFALHGRLDRVIPLVEAPWVEVVEDGRHLLPLTHPERVNAILAKALQ
jgi:pimeloyl-ACP methyl ester carboxylesterase